MSEILEPASLELADAAQYYEAARPGYGHHFLDEAAELFDLIDEMPLAGPPWLLDGIPPSTRRVLFKTFPYAMVYVTEPRLVVVAVAHGRREPTYWIDRYLDL